MEQERNIKLNWNCFLEIAIISGISLGLLQLSREADSVDRRLLHRYKFLSDKMETINKKTASDKGIIRHYCERK